MRIESKLSHISENKAVVQVNGWVDEKNLGSALGEGPTVEIAEDRAISRLSKRVKLVKSDEKIINSINENKINEQFIAELPKREKVENNNIKDDPSDWSNELGVIDSEIERLGWSREDEISFLEKNLGYNNRNKITNYNDLLRYIRLLKATDRSSQIKLDHRDFNILIEESDKILNDLSWDHIQGREYLQKEFNVSTRKELNLEQLISFVEKLKTIRNKFQAD